MAGQRMYGQYHVIERIAVGGMAEIYLGVAHGVEGFERPVVIKKVRRRFSRDGRFHSMLVKEAKITATLNHPNVVQILDLGQNDREEYFIVMEYVQGKDLRSVMDRIEEKGARLDWNDVLYIAAEICAALDYAHAKTDDNGRPLRLIHRDVSPSNILISRAGEVKLTDFGIARYGRDVSVVGSLKGKLAYMSPEQARTEPLDHRSDLFSLGAVMFEALLGRRVYAGETETELLDQAREARVPRPSSVDGSIPEELERILMRALAVDPEDRFATAEEMGVAIRSFQFQYSSRRVTPEQLAGLLGRLFPAEAEPPLPRRPSFQFTISTLVELQEQSFTLESSAPSVRSGQHFIDAVTNPGGPSPELLDQLRLDDVAVEPVRTRESSAPVFEEEEELLSTSRRQRAEPARRFPPLKPVLASAPVLAPLPAAGTAADAEFEERPTEVASSGLLDLRARSAAGEIAPEPAAEGGADGPENLTARVASIAASIEDLLEETDEREERPTAPLQAVSRAPEQPEATPLPDVEAAGPPEEHQEPHPEGATTVAPIPQREVMAQQPTRILPAESAAPHHEPPGQGDAGPPSPGPSPAEPTRIVPHHEEHEESPFAQVKTTEPPFPVAHPPPRRWGAWLLVALLGLSLGGGAALLLLLPGSPLRRHTAPEPPVVEVRPIGQTADAATRQDAALQAAKAAPDAGRADAARTVVATTKRPVERPIPVRPGPRNASKRGGRRPGLATDPGRVRVTDPDRVRVTDPDAPDRKPRTPRTGTGQVVIKSDPWAYIHVNGRDTKLTTSARPFTLRAGKHRVELVNPALGLRKTLTIEVEADGVVRRFVRLKD